MKSWIQNLPGSLQMAFYEKENKNVFCTIQGINPSTRIAIYGAGGFGQNACEIVTKMRKDVEVVCFIDTFKKGTLSGLPIFDI